VACRSFSQEGGQLPHYPHIRLPRLTRLTGDLPGDQAERHVNQLIIIYMKKARLSEKKSNPLSRPETHNQVTTANLAMNGTYRWSEKIAEMIWIA